MDRQTVLVLVSAIYFKAEWLHRFSETKTKPADFYVTPKQTVRVPTMHTVDAFFPYGETDGLQILELPYRAAERNDECSMVILLPKAKDGLAKLEASLTAARLRHLLSLPAGRGKFPVYLPKFSFSEQSRWGLVQHRVKCLGSKPSFRYGDIAIRAQRHDLGHETV